MVSLAGGPLKGHAVSGDWTELTLSSHFRRIQQASVSAVTERVPPIATSGQLTIGFVVLAAANTACLVVPGNRSQIISLVPPRRTAGSMTSTETPPTRAASVGTRPSS